MMAQASEKTDWAGVSIPMFMMLSMVCSFWLMGTPRAELYAMVGLPEEPSQVQPLTSALPLSEHQLTSCSFAIERYRWGMAGSVVVPAREITSLGVRPDGRLVAGSTKTRRPGRVLAMTCAEPAASSS